MISQYGGLKQLILMLSGSLSGMTVVEPVKGILGRSFKEEAGIKVGLREQAAITLAEMAKDDHTMQAAVIRGGGVPPLLTLIRLGSQLGQEHAARAIWHLAAYAHRTPYSCDSNLLYTPNASPRSHPPPSKSHRSHTTS